MSIGVKLLGYLVKFIVNAVIWMMIASGIEIWLRAKYEEREKMHQRTEQDLMENTDRIARQMYLQALSGTHVNVELKTSVIEDDLGKGCENCV